MYILKVQVIHMASVCPKLVLRPICFLLILGVCGYITFDLCGMIKHTEVNVFRESHGERNTSIAEIETTSRLLLPLNTSAMNLARSLSSALNGTAMSFVAIETKIAPTLFLALSTIPHVTQAAYVGSDGMMYSYFKDKDETVALFSNTSSPSYWYAMPVDRDTGKLYGEAIVSKPMITFHRSRFHEDLVNSTSGNSSLVKGWYNNQDNYIFLNSVAMDGRGVISLGFPTQVVADHFSALNFHGGNFHLATVDGDVILHTTLPKTDILVSNGTVLVQTFSPSGELIGHFGYAECASSDEKLRSFNGRIKGTEYNFYCSVLDIAGVNSVYVLAYPKDGLLDLVQKNSELSLLLLVLMFIFIFISFVIFIVVIIRAARREMYLCAAYVKQMNATQQAERKSMFKTKAYARANHDIRGILGVISYSLDLCLQEANLTSNIVANLEQLKTSTDDLLGILKSVLNMSKIEAGKMDLEEKEFNLAQLLEDVVDMFYPVGVKKGVDVLLDPCDGSIFKLALVKGDRVKLKQVLCNLLSNAIKFTSEGHVSVRAMVKKSSFEKEIIAHNRRTLVRCLSKLFCKNKEDFEDLNALDKVEQNPNKMVFEFEVDDTGKGIPKGKQASIFEEFFQVKEAGGNKESGENTETALDEEGCGLGLGIVQSIVRLMNGDIRIVEKAPGERGTCFRFSVLLTICQGQTAENEEEFRPNGSHQQYLLFIRNLATYKLEGCHVILYINGDERRRVLKRYMETFGIKVTTINHRKNLPRQLEKVKRKLDFSFSSSSADSLTTNVDPRANDNNATLGSKDENDNILVRYRKSLSRSSPGFVLLVIDFSIGVFSDLCTEVIMFKKDIPVCKVVWVEDPMGNNYSTRHQEIKLATPCDHVIHKPLHGSRLIQVLQILQERKGISLETLTAPPATTLKQIVIHEGDDDGSEKPLNGKKILVVEDTLCMQRMAVTLLGKLGANTEVCANGKEALEKICSMLKEEKGKGHSKTLFDFILMDCQMPEMNGYEATRLIRIEEAKYDVHIPIIALTASDSDAEGKNNAMEAGMDFHLIKPLREKSLLEIMDKLNQAEG